MARRTDAPAFSVRTVLGGETAFKGTIHFDESLKIDGRFEGAIDSAGFLLVDQGAEVIADVKVGSLVVGGLIKGDIEAAERLEVLPGGRVIGNIRTPNLIMAEGTDFQGRCEMLADPSGIDIFSAVPERLKKSLARV